jgi:Uma2 family endonuclease
MNIALRQALTVDDYLAWAETQAEAKRTELINGQIVFMSPELLAHTRIKGSVYFVLRLAIASAGIQAEVLTGRSHRPDRPAYGLPARCDG